jgi:hypothetical protein
MASRAAMTRAPLSLQAAERRNNLLLRESGLARQGIAALLAMAARGDLHQS